MISKKREESWSIWKAKGIDKEPKLIKSNRLATWVLPFFTSVKSSTLTTNEANTIPLPIILISDLGSCFLNKPFIRKPTSGKKGTNQTNCKTLFIQFLMLQPV